MPRDLGLGEKFQSPETHELAFQENTNPSRKDDEKFVHVSHDDADDAEDDSEDSEPPSLFRRFQGLHARHMSRKLGPTNKYDHLHPYVQVLSLSNVDDCVEVESVFPEHERCSREKFVYRLTKCPELTLGVFSLPTLSESANANSPPKAELVAHIICTRTAAPCVTDESMALPPGWQSDKTSFAEGEPLGHQDVAGGTIAIHALAVRAKHQRLGLGSMLIKSFIQRIKDSKTADRVALLAHDHLIKFYEGLGLIDMGESACRFGGGGWNNMILEFGEQQDD